MQGCYTCYRSFARELVYNLELRLGDLTRLNGAKLFMPRSWPRGVEARDAECKEHLHGLVHLFQAKNRDTIFKRKEQAAPEKERAKFVKGSGRRVLQVEEEELDEGTGMHGSVGDDGESDGAGSSSGDDESDSDDEM
ncbi:unnamed protein product [Closterium sp. Naga37s-1]|nr:unnamed protein product [Closterium sp. Naga37s-1]CAI5518246.1 unnamed protein product [Closterium sp. Naga37s-1]CAI5518251.1 unnamed protein product [Closterium sp. Naga37s-1]